MSTRELLRPHVRRHAWVLAGAALSSLVVAAADLARPWPIKLVVDELFHGGEVDLGAGDVWLLVQIAALVLLIALADAVASYVADLWLGRAGEVITHDLRVSLYDHLQRLSLRFHESRSKGDLVTRVTGDVNAVGELFSETLGTMAQSAILVAGMLAVSLALDPVVGLAVFAVMPPLALVSFRYRRKLKAAARRQRAQEGEIASLAAEALSAMPVVKAMGSERFEHFRLSRRSEGRRRSGVEVATIDARFAGSIDLIGAVGTALVIVLGVLRAAAGAVTPGDLVVFASYTRRAYRPLRDIARQASRASRSLARAERIAEILAADQVLEERGGAFRGGRAAGEVELDAVSFSYSPGRQALERVSLSIPQGSCVALVGASGAGKSTIGALIARFYDPDEGGILLDGRDLRDCSLPWLRSQVGLLLQDTVLFSGTVAENIAYGTNATVLDVVAAAKNAAAHDFIMALPEGYATQLGPGGRALSGGQRQRIGIARTLLRDPPVLVLDEPTTGLDADSEAEVLEGLQTLMRGRTTVLITHAMRIARSARHAVVLDGGRVVSEGPPDRVLPRRGLDERSRRSRRRLAIAPGAKPQPRVPSPPRDPALPWMPTLLDGEAMAPVLERSLGWDAEVGAVQGEYLRYKPGTSLLVHYSVAIGDRRHGAVVRIAADRSLRRKAERPQALRMAQRVDGRSPSASPLVYDAELDALIQWLPLDLDLPGLAEDPARLRRRLRDSGVPLPAPSGGCRLERYNPRRRAVLRLDGHVLKAYGSVQLLDAAAAALEHLAGEGFRAGGLVALLPDLRMTVQRALPGSAPSDPLAVAEAAGSLLAELHGAGAGWLPGASPEVQLAAAAATGELIGVVAPDMEGHVQRLLGRLEASVPATNGMVLSHGDFHARQLLVGEVAPAAIDFDRACAAPPALDLATYCAHLIEGHDGELDLARDALERLLAGYGASPAGLDWYLATAIVRRSNEPFRRLRPDWRARTAGMVEAAAEVLPR